MKYTAFVATSLMLLFAQPGTNDGSYKMQDGQLCPLAGTAKGAAVKKLNRHKNRFVAPDQDQIDPEVSLAAMLAPGNDRNRFDQDKGATITGYVIDVIIPQQGETCNCGATDQIDMDTHIEVSLHQEALPNQRVIVEVTPRLRKQMKDNGMDWSSQALQDPAKGIKGKWVEFTGWLLFDFMHTKGAENTNPGGQDVWRATCWEIHPVTSIKVLDGPPANFAEFQPKSLSQLQLSHARHADRQPRARQEINRRLEADVADLTPEERAERDKEEAARKPSCNK